MIKRFLLGVILFIYIILLFFSACTSLTKKQPHISHVRQMDKIFQNYDLEIDLIGGTTKEKYIKINDKIDLNTEEAKKLWLNGLRDKIK